MTGQIDRTNMQDDYFYKVTGIPSASHISCSVVCVDQCPAVREARLLAQSNTFVYSAVLIMRPMQEDSKLTVHYYDAVELLSLTWLLQ